MMLFYVVGGFYQLQNQGFAAGEEQIESNRLSQHHTIPTGTRLVVQGFVLMHDNDPITGQIILARGTKILVEVVEFFCLLLY